MHDKLGFSIVLLALGQMLLGTSLRMYQVPRAIKLVIVALMIATIVGVALALCVEFDLFPAPGFLKVLCLSLTGAMMLTALYVACRYRLAVRS